MDNFISGSTEKLKEHFLRDVDALMEKEKNNEEIKSSYRSLLSTYLEVGKETQDENAKIFEGNWILLGKDCKKKGRFNSQFLELELIESEAGLFRETRDFEKIQMFKFEIDQFENAQMEFEGTVSVEINEEGNLKVIVSIQPKCEGKFWEPYFGGVFEFTGVRENDIPPRKVKKRKISKRKK